MVDGTAGERAGTTPPLGAPAKPPFNIASDRLGISRVDGSILVGWPHCQQSIWDILTTRLNSRVMLLNYGAGVADLLDRPGNQQVIALWFASITTAIYMWEPGFRVTNFAIMGASNDGHYQLDLTGIFYPRGHLGDFSIVEDVAVSFLTPVQNGQFTIVSLVI